MSIINKLTTALIKINPTIIPTNSYIINHLRSFPVKNYFSSKKSFHLKYTLLYFLLYYLYKISNKSNVVDGKVNNIKLIN